jgi:hypothetical protein
MTVFRTSLVAAAVFASLSVAPSVYAADDSEVNVDRTFQAKIDGGDLLSLPLPPPRPLAVAPALRKPRKIAVAHRLEGASERRPAVVAAEPVKPLRFWMSVGTGF